MKKLPKDKIQVEIILKDSANAWQNLVPHVNGVTKVGGYPNEEVHGKMADEFKEFMKKLSKMEHIDMTNFFENVTKVKSQE